MNRKFLVLALLYLNLNIGMAQSFNDCKNPFPICELKTYHFGFLNGFGEIQESFGDTKCFERQHVSETNSVWLSMDVAKAGVLTFSIVPLEDGDDLDFVLYRSTDGCNSLQEVRCMASGLNIGSGKRSDNCLGETGLRLASVDEFESQGCKYNDDNFLKFLSTDSNEEYFLLVNNYNSTNGFSITFEGNTVLKESEKCNFIQTKEDLVITNIFPNPAQNQLSIEFVSQEETDYKLSVLDIQGRKVFGTNHLAKIGLNHKFLNLEEYASGTYLLLLESDSFTTIKQFIKE